MIWIDYHGGGGIWSLSCLQLFSTPWTAAFLSILCVLEKGHWGEREKKKLGLVFALKKFVSYPRRYMLCIHVSMFPEKCMTEYQVSRFTISATFIKRIEKRQRPKRYGIFRRIPWTWQGSKQTLIERWRAKQTADYLYILTSILPRTFPAHTLSHVYPSVRRRRWHPTPVLLPGKSHGQRSLVGCHLWDLTESDTTEAT